MLSNLEDTVHFAPRVSSASEHIGFLGFFTLVKFLMGFAFAAVAMFRIACDQIISGLERTQTILPTRFLKDDRLLVTGRDFGFILNAAPRVTETEPELTPESERERKTVTQNLMTRK